MCAGSCVSQRSGKAQSILQRSLRQGGGRLAAVCVATRERRALVGGYFGGESGYDAATARGRKDFAIVGRHRERALRIYNWLFGWYRRRAERGEINAPKIKNESCVSFGRTKRQLQLNATQQSLFGAPNPRFLKAAAPNAAAKGGRGTRHPSASSAAFWPSSEAQTPSAPENPKAQSKMLSTGQKGLLLGVQLGNTTCKIARLRPTGDAELIAATEEGERTIPVSIAFKRCSLGDDEGQGEGGRQKDDSLVRAAWRGVFEVVFCAATPAAGTAHFEGFFADVSAARSQTFDLRTHFGDLPDAAAEAWTLTSADLCALFLQRILAVARDFAGVDVAGVVFSLSGSLLFGGEKNAEKNAEGGDRSANFAAWLRAALSHAKMRHFVGCVQRDVHVTSQAAAAAFYATKMRLLATTTPLFVCEVGGSSSSFWRIPCHAPLWVASHDAVCILRASDAASGAAFDAAAVAHFGAVACKTLRCDALSTRGSVRLRTAVRALKSVLSHAATAALHVESLGGGGGGDFSLPSFSRGRLEALLEGPLAAWEAQLRAACCDDVTPPENVLLIGASARLPFVRDRVVRAVAANLVSLGSEDAPDDVAAKGACLLAAFRFERRFDAASTAVRLLGASLSVRCFAAGQNDTRCVSQRLVAAGTEIPFERVAVSFAEAEAAADSHEARFEIVEGDGAAAAGVRILCAFSHALPCHIAAASASSDDAAKVRISVGADAAVSSFEFDI